MSALAPLSRNRFTMPQSPIFAANIRGVQPDFYFMDKQYTVSQMKQLEATRLECISKCNGRVSKIFNINCVCMWLQKQYSVHYGSHECNIWTYSHKAPGLYWPAVHGTKCLADLMWIINVHFVALTFHNCFVNCFKLHIKSSPGPRFCFWSGKKSNIETQQQEEKDRRDRGSNLEHVKVVDCWLCRPCAPSGIPNAYLQWVTAFARPIVRKLAG